MKNNSLKTNGFLKTVGVILLIVLCAITSFIITMPVEHLPTMIQTNAMCGWKIAQDSVWKTSSIT